MAAILTFAMSGVRGPAQAVPQRARLTLPTTPGSYIGLYPDGVPSSYAGVTAFAAATGVRPSVVPYYSGWLEPFQARFAAAAAEEHAVPLVQMDPDDVSVAKIGLGATTAT